MKSKSSVIVYLIIVLCLVTSSIWVIKKNKVALEYVKDYYDTHTEKRDAAIFLLNHLNYKYHYAGTLLNYYDKALSIYDSLRNAGIVVGDPPAALNVWEENKKSPEVELTGTIFGYPELNTGQPHPYIHAMDEDYNTFFGKAKDEIGYVGIDLGEGNEHYLTKIRFYPRSDTNYILPGNVYELCYWTETGWKSIGEQTAMNHHLIFNDVPSGTFYILHNLTKGKEERIFTYENGQQIWW